MSMLRDWPTGLALVFVSFTILAVGVSHEANRYWAGFTTAHLVEADATTVQ